MHQQINEYFESLLSFIAFQTRIQCKRLPFRDVQKMEKIRDNKGVFAAVVTEFSETFDCITNGLIIKTLSAFGFDKLLSFISAIKENKKLRLAQNLMIL